MHRSRLARVEAATGGRGRVCAHCGAGGPVRYEVVIDDGTGAPPGEAKPCAYCGRAPLPELVIDVGDVD